MIGITLTITLFVVAALAITIKVILTHINSQDNNDI